MSELIDKIAYYFTFPMVQKAMIVGLLIALCSSLLGVTLVLKRLSFIGDGLSHVAFGAMSVAVVAGFTEKNVIILPVTVLTAILLLRTGKNAKIKGDAAVAMLSVGALAAGYMLINVFSKSANVAGDVCSTLFGSTLILTLSDSDVWLCIIMSVIVMLIYLLFYNKIFAVTFDEDFSKATGVKSDLYNTVIAIVTALIIVLAMNLVGSLLISALIIFPALSSMRLFKSFKGVVVCSALISVLCASAGILAAILFSTPVGSTIVTADIIMFILFSLISMIKGKA